MPDSPTTAGLARSGLDALFGPLGGPGRTVAGPTGTPHDEPADRARRQEREEPER
ncbi:hypothetical protein ACFC08_06145 [Streptomyces sp. NPDC056112]|uniref:hypothetical protein n=1 Tax=unclassified Streptomyces TaxID=2593676 RepID=UPI001CD781DD|nr:MULTISPECIES: hypothetical protein [unclassified Streptomyces]